MISFTPKARISIIDRNDLFYRYGVEEKNTLALFNYLDTVHVDIGGESVIISNEPLIEIEDELYLLNEFNAIEQAEQQQLMYCDNQNNPNQHHLNQHYSSGVDDGKNQILSTFSEPEQKKFSKNSKFESVRFLFQAKFKSNSFDMTTGPASTSTTTLSDDCNDTNTAPLSDNSCIKLPKRKYRSKKKSKSTE